jgi:hypothetical protein
MECVTLYYNTTDIAQFTPTTQQKPVDNHDQIKNTIIRNENKPGNNKGEFLTAMT